MCFVLCICHLQVILDYLCNTSKWHSPYWFLDNTFGTEFTFYTTSCGLYTAVHYQLRSLHCCTLPVDVSTLLYINSCGLYTAVHYQLRSLHCCTLPVDVSTLLYINSCGLYTAVHYQLMSLHCCTLTVAVSTLLYITSSMFSKSSHIKTQFWKFLHASLLLLSKCFSCGDDVKCLRVKTLKVFEESVHRWPHPMGCTPLTAPYGMYTADYTLWDVHR